MTPLGMFGSDQVRNIEVRLGSPIISTGGEEATNERHAITTYHSLSIKHAYLIIHTMCILIRDKHYLMN